MTVRFIKQIIISPALQWLGSLQSPPSLIVKRGKDLCRAQQEAPVKNLCLQQIPFSVLETEDRLCRHNCRYPEDQVPRV
jgi:hypothetical protein